MRVKCPKCGSIENIDSTYINCECECECGYNFIISKQNIVKTIVIPKQKMTINTPKNSTIQKYTAFNRLTYFFHLLASMLVALFAAALFGMWTPMHILILIFINIWQAIITYNRVVDYGGYGVTSVICLGLGAFLSILSNVVNPSFGLFLIIVSIYNFIIFIKCLTCPSKHKTY